MRVWQPGSHLTVERGQSPTAGHGWKRTRRRLLALARLAKPYKGRVALALGFLLIATLAALAPPYLAKLAIDDGIAKGDLTALGWIVAAFVATGLVYLGANAAQTYFTGWTGERVLADLRNGLFRHLQRLSLGYYERNRAGVIISRLTNDIDALDQLVTEGVTSLLKNTLLLLGSVDHPLHTRLAARARHADGDAGAHRRDRDVPLPLHASPTAPCASASAS